MAGEKNEKSKISGRVFSEGGAILNGAKVTCDSFETLTLADGLYVFDGLSSGEYGVKVSLQGFRSQSKKVFIKDDETAVLNFNLAAAVGAGKIKGRVYDSDSGKPMVNGGTVILILPISNKYAHIDAEGYYEFVSLPPDDYKVVTSIPEYDDCEAILALADGESKTCDFSCKARRAVEPNWG